MLSYSWLLSTYLGGRKRKRKKKFKSRSVLKNVFVSGFKFLWVPVFGRPSRFLFHNGMVHYFLFHYSDVRTTKVRLNHHWPSLQIRHPHTHPFFSILLTHKGSHREAYRDFQPSLTSSTGGSKGFSDHRFCAPPAYTAQLLTLHQHRANNQYRTANQI